MIAMKAAAVCGPSDLPLSIDGDRPVHLSKAAIGLAVISLGIGALMAFSRKLPGRRLLIPT
jgi:hypothetical protein